MTDQDKQPDRATSESPYASPRADSAGEDNGKTFSLASMFLGILVIAVALGVGVLSVGLGFVSFVVGTLLFLRFRVQRSPRSPDARDWRSIMFFSVTALLIIPSCLVAFFATCLAGGFGFVEIFDLGIHVPRATDDWILPVGIACGIISAVLTAMVLVRNFQAPQKP